MSVVRTPSACDEKVERFAAAAMLRCGRPVPIALPKKEVVVFQRLLQDRRQTTAWLVGRECGFSLGSGSGLKFPTVRALLLFVTRTVESS